MKSKILLLCLIAFALMDGRIKAELITTNVAIAPSGVIIDASPSYNSFFPVTNVIDGDINEADNASPISYWLSPTSDPLDAYFTLDLRRSYSINSIVLYNTHNRQYHDTGSVPFVVYGANAVQPWIYSGSVARYFPLNGDIQDRSSNNITATFYNANNSPASYDASSNAITPTFSTNVPAALTGHNQSLYFSGVGDHLDFVDPPFSGQPNGYSISVWVRLEVVQPCNVIVRCTGFGPDYPSFSPQLRINTNDNFEFCVASDNTHTTLAATNVVVQPDTWYYVVATAESTATGQGIQCLYVNGVEENTFLIPIGNPNLNFSPNAPFWAGGDRWNAGGAVYGGWAPMDGEMADLAIWYSTALTPGMVSSLASGESPLKVATSPLAGVGYKLVNPQVVASGTLSAVSTTTIPPETFAVSPPITARYVKFEILGSDYPNVSGVDPLEGINEIQVMSQVDNTPPPVTVDNALFLNWANPGLQENLQASQTLTPPVWSTSTSLPNLWPTLFDTNWGVNVVATNSAGFYRVSDN